MVVLGELSPSQALVKGQTSLALAVSYEVITAEAPEANRDRVHPAVKASPEYATSDFEYSRCSYVCQLYRLIHMVGTPFSCMELLLHRLIIQTIRIDQDGYIVNREKQFNEK